MMASTLEGVELKVSMGIGKLESKIEVMETKIVEIDKNLESVFDNMATSMQKIDISIEEVKQVNKDHADCIVHCIGDTMDILDGSVKSLVDKLWYLETNIGEVKQANTTMTETLVEGLSMTMVTHETNVVTKMHNLGMKLHGVEMNLEAYMSSDMKIDRMSQQMDDITRHNFGSELWYDKNFGSQLSAMESNIAHLMDVILPKQPREPLTDFLDLGSSQESSLGSWAVPTAIPQNVVDATSPPTPTLVEDDESRDVFLDKTFDPDNGSSNKISK